MPTWLSDDGPTLMAVVNVNADSFSDPRGTTDPTERLATARAAMAAGAAIIDLGAQSAALDADRVPLDVQVRALVPLVEALAAGGIPVSVDTHEAAVARAVLAVGAGVVNDFSGAADPALLEAVAEADAWYVLTHNPVGFRRRQTDAAFYDDVVDAVLATFDDGVERLVASGVRSDRILLDPGVDAGKTPAQSLALLRGRDRIRAAVDQPLLWAISRKDVLGALSGRPPAERDAGTMALLSALAAHPRTIARVHDVAAARDVLTVHAALAGNIDVGPALLDDDLRREPS